MPFARSLAFVALVSVSSLPAGAQGVASSARHQSQGTVLADAGSKAPIVPPIPRPAKAPPTKDTNTPNRVSTPSPPKNAGKSAVIDTPIPPPVPRPAPKKADTKKDKKKKAKVRPAKAHFGAKRRAANLKARAIGWYAKGCLAGGKQLAADGPAWQAMRLSRNRNWGHPKLVDLVERLAREAKANGEWPGLLVGDLTQPRGGPMTSGHASHQVGLDADVWLTPMPDRKLSWKEREKTSATSMLSKEVTKVNPKVFGEGQVKLIKRAASYRAVERVLVHPAIKKALCEAAGDDKSWLAKVRPYWGHYYHMHIRIGCPSGSNNCRSQNPPPGGHGCGAELAGWIKKITPSKKKTPKKVVKSKKPRKKRKKKRDIMLSDLPSDCRSVLSAKATDTLPATKSALDAAPAPKAAASSQ
jgi:penicillin-insensitive murein DD-endopeptidase